MVENHKMIVENSGLDGSRLKAPGRKEKKIVSVLSGGNMDVSLRWLPLFSTD